MNQSSMFATLLLCMFFIHNEQAKLHVSKKKKQCTSLSQRLHASSFHDDETDEDGIDKEASLLNNPFTIEVFSLSSMFLFVFTCLFHLSTRTVG